MNLMNCSVKHISWGIGTVTEQKDNKSEAKRS